MERTRSELRRGLLFVLGAVVVVLLVVAIAYAIAISGAQSSTQLVVRAVDEPSQPVVEVNASTVAEEAPDFWQLLLQAQDHGDASTRDQETIQQGEDFIRSRHKSGISGVTLQVEGQYYEFRMNVL